MLALARIASSSSSLALEQAVADDLDLRDADRLAASETWYCLASRETISSALTSETSAVASNISRPSSRASTASTRSQVLRRPRGRARSWWAS